MKVKYSKCVGQIAAPMYEMTLDHYAAMVTAQVSDPFIVDRLLFLARTGKPVRLLGNQFVPLLHPELERVTPSDKGV